MEESANGLKVLSPGVILTDVGNTAKEQERRLFE